MFVDATTVQWKCRSAEPAALRPPRLNCARRCLRCGEHDCDSIECIRWHAASHWVVCPDCGGEEWSECLEPCGCISGVIEAYPPSPSAAPA